MQFASLTFEEYWELFVQAHADADVRSVHFVATSAGLGVLSLGALTRRVSLVVLGSAVALLAPWAARKLGGSERTLPFHPTHAARASAKMWHLSLVGTMDAEVARVLGREADEPPPSSDGPLPRPNMVTDHTLH